MGRIRLHVALDCTAYSLETFILENIEPGSTIATDSLRSYSFLDKGAYVHEITIRAEPRITKTYMVFTWLRPW